jgi:hypothetical protein
MKMRLPLVIWYSQGLLAPVIAVVAAYIAWQQWRMNALRSKMDLFDRRFEVFLKARHVLSSLLPEAKVNMEEFLKFRTGVAEAYFIFGPEMEDYLDQIYKHAVEFSGAHMLYRLPKEERPDVTTPRK